MSVLCLTSSDTYVVLQLFCILVCLVLCLDAEDHLKSRGKESDFQTRALAVQEEASLKDYLILALLTNFVRRSRTVWAILVEGFSRNTCEKCLKFGQQLRCLKIYFFVPRSRTIMVIEFWSRAL